MPSSRSHSSTTAFVVCVPSANPGFTAAARSANSRIAAYSPGAAARSLSGSPSPGTGQVTSPETLSGSRLVARIPTFGQALNSPWESSAHAPSRCSQLSSTTSSRAAPTRFPNASISDPTSWRRPSVTATDFATSAGSASAASSTSHTPSGWSSSAARATCSANLVLPEPPAPVSVTSLAAGNSFAISASSRSRPMNDVSSTGRL